MTAEFFIDTNVFIYFLERNDRYFESVVPFESTGLPEEQRQGDLYVWIRQGAKNGRQRFVPLNTPERMTALAQAQRVVSGYDAHLGDPSRDLKRNLRHFGYVLEKFGVTGSKLGITAHGLRHEGSASMKFRRAWRSLHPVIMDRPPAVQQENSNKIARKRKLTSLTMGLCRL